MYRSPLLVAIVLAIACCYCLPLSAQESAPASDAPLEEIATESTATNSSPPQLQNAPLPADWAGKIDPSTEPQATTKEEVPVEPPTSVPSEKETKTNLITNTFFDTELRQALQDIASQAGVTIIAGQGISGVVSVELKDTPLDKALELVLAGTGYIIKKTPDFYLVTSAEADSPDFLSNSELSLVHIDYATPTNIIKLLPEAYQAYIKADDKSRAVTVTAPEELKKRIIGDLKTLDVRPRQILLQVRVVALENLDLFNAG